MVRKIIQEDRLSYIDMAKKFYSSDSVSHNIPEINIIKTFNELMRSDDYAAGYILEYENKTAGYVLLAKTFSQEAGGIVLWIEELYVNPEYRCRGLGHEFFTYLRNNLCDNVKRIRLEATNSNKKAISLYMSMGFKDLPYSQLIKDL